MAEVKLFRSQRLTDNPDGGGLSTSTEVVDGEVNNLFDDISRIDRVNGDLSLRKVFQQAVTEDNALFAGMHVIVQAPPLDERVSVVLFRTRGANGRYSWSDEREQAQAAVERYLDASVLTRMIPYDRQLAGQRSVLVFQRPELALPEIGQVYALEDPATGFIEYIAIQDLEHEVQTFIDASSNFFEYPVRVITLTVTQPLSREFAGTQPNRVFEVGSGGSVLRRTIVSDAARYRGIVKLAEDTAPGATQIKLESVFAQLVPATTSEVAILDATPGGLLMPVKAASAQYTFWMGSTSGDVGRITSPKYVPTPILPGSLSFLVGSGTVVADMGDGRLMLGNSQVGTIDYQLGRINLSQTAGWGLLQDVRAVYTPAAFTPSAGQTEQTAIELSNRGFVYTKTLTPLPTPGSTSVSFRALGRWHTLEDDGSGALVGEAGTGTGLVNYTTGTVVVTCGAMPDVGSSLIYSWGTPAEFRVVDGVLDLDVPAVSLQLSAGNCEPGSLSVTWTAGAATKTATDDGHGNISGDATGRVVYATGAVLLRPAVLPDATAVYQASYEAADHVQENFNPSLVGGNVQITVADAPIRPGSVQVSYSIPLDLGTESYYFSRVLTDNGSGAMLDETGAVVPGSSVNYTTGLIAFDPEFMVKAASYTRTSYEKSLPSRIASAARGYYGSLSRGGNWQSQLEEAIVSMSFVPGTPVAVVYKPDAAVDDSHTEYVDQPALVVDLTRTTSAPIVPGSVLFTLAGRTYYDRSGTLYYSLGPSTGAGTVGGTINYSTGVALITSWAPNVAAGLTLQALLTQPGSLPVEVVNGRVQATALRPGSFTLRAVRQRDGANISATADNNGNLASGGMHGYVDVTTGVFAVGFGAYVLDSGLSPGDKSEDWYDPANIDEDGYIWRPDPVVPGSIYFNGVAIARLPLDPEIIGVNPVRLPMDGRVQAIRAGDTLVIHDTLPTVLSTVSAGSTHSLGRENVNSVAVYDAAGLGIDPALFTLNGVAGEITWADPLDLTGYTQPFTALDTVEEMALCLDAQITGEVTLGTSLLNGYSADNSYCSSALILGDMRSRYEHLFAQATWTNVWSDELIGSAPSSGALYNDVDYPIQVNNRDAITMRWRLAFTSSTAFNIVAEELGVIGTGNTSTNVAPINPANGEPYFVIAAAGFGSGWSTGNTIRFNTVAAGAPFWAARTVLSGPAYGTDDRARLQMRWDKD